MLNSLSLQYSFAAGHGNSHASQRPPGLALSQTGSLPTGLQQTSFGQWLTGPQSQHWQAACWSLSEARFVREFSTKPWSTRPIW